MKSFSMRLNELLEGLDTSGRSSNPEVCHLSQDSRNIARGGLFIALKGGHVDARDYIRQVFERGVVAVLVDAGDLPELDASFTSMQNVIQVKNLRLALSGIAARFYGQPSRQLRVIGVTGTNGKTTIAWYLAQSLQALGVAAGVVGTLGAGPVGEQGQGGDKLVVTGLTTPDALQIQALLAEMLDQNIEVVCLEVSSHGLALGRVSQVNFDSTVFSNLSQDHLDFHQTMAEYARAKARLFEEYRFNRAVINIDDELGQRIAGNLGDKCLTYGVGKGKLRATDIRLAPHGVQFTVQFGQHESVVNTNLIGEFNVYNLLAVIGTGLAMGYTLDTLVSVISQCRAVPGRMERIRAHADQPYVVVDYAHTPDALDKVLQACRSHCRGSLAVVFGCGGDRDKAKRSEMGRIAERFADDVFLTDDNPRSEPPAAIVTDIKRGMEQPAWVLHDRAQAINAAVTKAKENDWVLIAGKGHETSQVYADRVIDFDDRVVARQALERMAA